MLFNSLILSIVIETVLLTRAADAGNGQGYTFRRYKVDASDARLSMSPNVSEIQRPVEQLSRIQCAAICTKYDAWCTAYSYQRNGSNAFCRLAEMNSPLVKESGNDSRVYSMSPEGQPPAIWDADGFFVSRKNGFSYKRVAVSVESLVNARSVCTSISASIPVPYPADGSHYLELQEVVRPGDVFYVGMTKFGSFSERVFITDTGNKTIVAQRSMDSAQHWFPNQPNATNDVDGQAVIMHASGGKWDDVSATTLVNSVICSKWTGYELRENGKYYHLVTTPLADWFTAKDRCIREGGRLASPLGAEAREIVGQYWLAAGVATNTPQMNLFADGQKLVEGSYTWTFQNGETFDERFAATDPSGLYSWSNTNPQRRAGENCIIICSASGDLCDWYCTGIDVTYLCERFF